MRWTARHAPARDRIGYRNAGWWSDRTILDDLCDHARRSPRSVAIVDHRRDGTTRTLTYRQVRDLTHRAAENLTENGVRPGDRVAYQASNRWEAAVLPLACWRLRAVAVPLLPDLGPQDVQRITTATQPCLTVFEEPAPDAQATRLSSIFAERPTGDRSTPTPDPHIPPDTTCLVLFTSGTTGEPKAVHHSLNTLRAASLQEEAAEPALRPKTLSTPHSLCHAGGLHVWLSVLVRGGRAVFQQSWDAHRFLHMLRAEHVDYLRCSPPYLEQLIATAGRAGAPLPDLRFVLSGSTPVGPRIVREAEKAFGARVLTVWGMTEVGAGTIVRLDASAGGSGHTLGRPVPGTEIRLTPTDDADLDAQALWVRGPSLCLMAARTADAGDADSPWYETGDLVAPEPDGGIRFLSRRADRVGGVYMIPVLEVEDEIRRIPGVVDAVVVGYEGPGQEELPCAIVVPVRDPVALDTLQSSLRASGMANRYIPTRVENVTHLPRNATGKIDRKSLRELVRATSPSEERSQ